MFDERLTAAGGSAALLGALVIDNHDAEKVSGCRKLLLAAERADTHGDPDARHDPTGDGAPLDPARGRRRRSRARLDVEEYVRVGGVGIPTIAEIAGATTGDATLHLAMINRIADCLADEGDEDPAPVRRSKALGILANPPPSRSEPRRLPRHRPDRPRPCRQSNAAR